MIRNTEFSIEQNTKILFCIRIGKVYYVKKVKSWESMSTMKKTYIKTFLSIEEQMIDLHQMRRIQICLQSQGAGIVSNNLILF